MQIEYKKRDSDRKGHYPRNLKKSLILTLVFFNLAVWLSPRLAVQVEEKQLPSIVINVENVPVTRQPKRTSPPPRPSVPVPSEKEIIPEDLVISKTTLNTNIFDDTPDSFPGVTGVAVVPPRPIAWAFPEFPESEKKRGIEGVVKLSIHIDSEGNVIEVVVLDNTTGSEKCALAAKEAAYRSRFYPAREGRNPVNFWITQPYSFALSQ